MRRLMLVLLMLLLPWRLWAADSMSLSAWTDAAGVLAPCHQTGADSAPHTGLPLDEVARTQPVEAIAYNGDAGTTDAGGLPVDVHDAATQHSTCPICGICHQTLGSPAAHAALQTALATGPALPKAAFAQEVEPQRVLEPPRA
jgi:hypothetical protein